MATGSITSGSSREIKQDIDPLSYEQASDLVAALDAVSFAYLSHPDQPRLGYLAEEVAEVFGSADRKGVDAAGITASLVLLAQQQQTEIDALFELIQPLHAGLGVESLASGAHSLLSSTTREILIGNAGLQALAYSGVADPGVALAAVGQTGPLMVLPISAQAVSEVAPGILAPLVAGDTVPAFQIVENSDQWMRLVETGGTGWNFTHVSNPSLGIDSALSINIDGSPRDLYLADEPGGLRMYLWNDGLAVPNLPHTGVKPNFAISGDMLVGDLITMGRGPRGPCSCESRQASAPLPRPLSIPASTDSTT